MAFTQVQTANNSGNTTALAITVSATSANNLLVISIERGAGTISSVTDDKGNTYILSTILSYGRLLYQAYGIQITGGVTIVTVNGTLAFTRAAVDEYSGFSGGGAINNTSVFVATTTGNGTGTSASVSTLTPSAAGNLIVATLGNSIPVGWTAGTNYTLYGNVSDWVRSQYRLSSSTSETAPATLASSATWGEFASAFRVPAVTSIPHKIYKTNQAVRRASSW